MAHTLQIAGCILPFPTILGFMIRTAIKQPAWYTGKETE
jgi:hypothetical protein